MYLVLSTEPIVDLESQKLLQLLVGEITNRLAQLEKTSVELREDQESGFQAEREETNTQVQELLDEISELQQAHRLLAPEIVSRVSDIESKQQLDHQTLQDLGATVGGLEKRMVEQEQRGREQSPAPPQINIIMSKLCNCMN